MCVLKIDRREKLGQKLTCLPCHVQQTFPHSCTQILINHLLLVQQSTPQLKRLSQLFVRASYCFILDSYLSLCSCKVIHFYFEVKINLSSPPYFLSFPCIWVLLITILCHFQLHVYYPAVVRYQAPFDTVFQNLISLVHSFFLTVISCLFPL